jgi:hypothetical protein
MDSFTLVNMRNFYSAVVSKSQLVYYVRDIKHNTFPLIPIFSPFVLKYINCSLQTTHDYMGIRKRKERKNRKIYTMNLQQTSNTKNDQHQITIYR